MSVDAPSTAPPPARFPWSVAAFWLAALLALFNLNGLARMAWGVGQAGIIALLLCCAFLARLAFRSIPWRQALGVPGVLLLASWAGYVLIGMVAGLAVAGPGLQWTPHHQAYLFRCGMSFLIIAGVAYGGAMAARRHGSERLMRILLLLLALNCLLTLASPVLATWYRFPSPELSYRFSGVFWDANEAGLVGCLAVALGLALLGRGEASRVWGLFPALALSTVAVLASFSRIAIVVLLLLLCCHLFSRARVARLTVMALFFIGAGLALNVERLPLQPQQAQRVESLLNLGDFDVERHALQSAFECSRFHVWGQALPRVLEAPLSGQGFGAFRFIKKPPRCQEGGEFLGVHNLYLLLLGESGLIPLVLFLLFLGGLLWLPWRRPGAVAAPVVAGWALVIAIYGLVSHSALNHGWSAFIVGLSCALAAGTRSAAVDKT